MCSRDDTLVALSALNLVFLSARETEERNAKQYLSAGIHVHVSEGVSRYRGLNTSH